MTEPDGGYSMLPTTWVQYECPEDGCKFKVDIPELHLEMRREPGGTLGTYTVGYDQDDTNALLRGMFAEHYRRDHTMEEWDALLTLAGERPEHHPGRPGGVRRGDEGVPGTAG